MASDAQSEDVTGVAQHNRRFLVVVLFAVLLIELTLLSKTIFGIPVIIVYTALPAIVLAAFAACVQIAREELRTHAVSKKLLYTLGSLVVVSMLSAILLQTLPDEPAVGANETAVGVAEPSSPPRTGALSSSPEASAPVRPPVTAPTTPITANHNCPQSGAQPTLLPDVEICVTNWCMASLVNGDGSRSVSTTQLKLRPRIINNSTEAVDVSISRFSAIRVLVQYDGNLRWDPPSVTENLGDEPVRVSWQGREYWAISPNAEGDASLLTLPDGSRIYDGFATSWDFSLLDPGGSVNLPVRLGVGGQVIQEGNLVFQLSADQGAELAGLALVTRESQPEVLSASMFDQWPPESNLNSF